MQSIFLVVLIGLLGGVAVATQASLAGIFSERVGLIGNGLFVFGGGFLFALILSLFVGIDQLKTWRTVPWYAPLREPVHGASQWTQIHPAFFGRYLHERRKPIFVLENGELRQKSECGVLHD